MEADCEATDCKLPWTKEDARDYFCYSGRGDQWIKRCVNGPFTLSNGSLHASDRARSCGRQARRSAVEDNAVKGVSANTKGKAGGVGVGGLGWEGERGGKG